MAAFTFHFPHFPPSHHTVMDAIVFYNRQRNLKLPLKSSPFEDETKFGVTLESTHFLDKHYQLFGHANSVHLAQVGRTVSVGMLQENTEAIAKHFNLSTHSDDDTLSNVLCAAAVDLLYWKAAHLPHGSAYATGLDVCTFAGFLLRSVSDDDFASERRLKCVGKFCASSITESTLGELLGRLVLSAEKMLSKFCPYDANISQAIERLRNLL